MTESGFKSQVISLGRITIPKKLRTKLGIKEGDHVQIEGIRKLVVLPQKNPKKEA